MLQAGLVQGLFPQTRIGMEGSQLLFHGNLPLIHAPFLLVACFAALCAGDFSPCWWNANQQGEKQQHYLHCAFSLSSFL